MKTKKRECVYETHPPSDLAELLCYKLVCGSPFATDGRNDGAFFLEFGKGFIDFLAVRAERGGYLASRNRLACCTHGS